MRRVGAPGECSPHLRWGRPRGMMREKSHEGHSNQILMTYGPAHWLSGLQMPGQVGASMASWRALVGADPVQATGGEQPTVGISPGGLPSALGDGVDDNLKVTGAVITTMQFSVVSVSTNTGGASECTVVQRDGADWYSVAGAVHGWASGKVVAAARGNATNWKVATTVAPVGRLTCLGTTHDLSLGGAVEIVMYMNGVADPWGSQGNGNNTIAPAGGDTYFMGAGPGGAAREMAGYLCEHLIVPRTLTAEEMMLASRVLSWRANRQ